MAKILFTPTFVKSTSCPPGKRKVEYYDERVPNFVLEIRGTGGKTYALRYSDRHGRRRQYRIGDAAVLTLAQAREQARKVQAELELGRDPQADRERRRQVPTLGEFVDDQYLPFVQRDKKSWKLDETYLRLHVLPRFGRKTLDAFRVADFRRLQMELLSEDYAKTTVNQILILCRYVFNCALRWEQPGVEKNPTRGVKLLKADSIRQRFLTKAEADRLRAALDASPYVATRDIIILLLLTGARRGEVLAARWRDINLDTRMWYLPTNKSGKPRTVPLSSAAVTHLREVARRARAGAEYVFENPKTGRPYTKVQYQWNRIRRAAGLPDLRIHDLRHTFASWLVTSGRSLYTVQLILGHSDAKTTQRYAHLAHESLVDAAEVAGTVWARNQHQDARTPGARAS